MIRTRALGALALAVSATLATATANAKVTKSSQGHGHHLLKAEKDLEAAQTALTAQDVKTAEKDVGAAIRQVEDAIRHHKTHAATQPKTAAAGANHQKHHDHLKQVVAELRTAEKELHKGAIAQAGKEIQRAEDTLKAAIAHHQQAAKK
jgi:hypothetical protein